MKIKALKLTSLFASTLLFSVLYSSCGKQQTAQMPQAPEIAVMTVQPTTSELYSNYPATLKGKTDVAIRPQISGFITKVHVDEGQQVREGQVLFTIDQVQFQAAVDQAKAAVASATSAVSTAEITEKNKKILLDKNIISEYEWQTSANQLAQARAQLAQAKAALVNANKNMAYTTVTSPCDGVVGSIPNREGSLASPSSMPLTTVSDNRQVYAYFSLTEKDLLSMTEGGATMAERIASMPEVKLMLADGTTYQLSGKVATVSGVIDTSTGSASVRALFDNPNGVLRSGNTGTIVIPQVSENVISIPQKATFELQDLRYVFTVNDSNVTQSTPIKVLSLNDGKNFVVTEGLNAGDRIVTEGVGTIVRNGITIRPKTSEQATAAAAN